MKLYANSREDGFTYIEVLTALLILSLSSLVLWSGLTQAISLVEKIHRKNKEIQEIALLEYYLRDEVGRFGPSYWDMDNSEDYTGLSKLDDNLVLESDLGKRYFTSLELLEQNAVSNGVSFLIHTKSGRTVELLCRYGRFSLKGVEPVEE